MIRRPASGVRRTVQETAKTVLSSALSLRLPLAGKEGITGTAIDAAAVFHVIHGDRE